VELVIAAGQVARLGYCHRCRRRASPARRRTRWRTVSGPLDEQWLAVSTQRATAGASPSSRHVRRTCAANGGAVVACRADVAEPDLATPGPGIRWCLPEDRALGSGFVRLPDGAAFAAGPPDPAGALPAELALALANARRDGERLAPVQAEAAVADDGLARWQR
jgi:hypothetical protein